MGGEGGGGEGWVGEVEGVEEGGGGEEGGEVGCSRGRGLVGVFGEGGGGRTVLR